MSFVQIAHMGSWAQGSDLSSAALLAHKQGVALEQLGHALESYRLQHQRQRHSLISCGADPPTLLA